MSSMKSQADIWREWRDLVNISPKGLSDWLDADELKSFEDKGAGESTGHASGRLINTKKIGKHDLTDDQWDHMAKVTACITRHLAQGGPAKDKEHSNWRYLLMNWGHDPLK